LVFSDDIPKSSVAFSLYNFLPNKVWYLTAICGFVSDKLKNFNYSQITPYKPYAIGENSIAVSSAYDQQNDMAEARPC
jgi:hypothetical protein